MIYIIGFTDMESNIRKLRLEIAFLDLDKNEQCYRLKDFGEVYPWNASTDLNSYRCKQCCLCVENSFFIKQYPIDLIFIMNIILLP